MLRAEMTDRQTFARITEEPIRPDLLLRAGSDGDGAVVLFIGRVRDRSGDRQVRRLRYETYREMAERELADILADSAARWSLSHLEAVHRTGTLEVGEVSLAIVVAAPHRAVAYEASRHVIEEVKKRLPIWKHEEYADGEASWVGLPPSEV